MSPSPGFSNKNQISFFRLIVYVSFNFSLFLGNFYWKIETKKIRSPMEICHSDQNVSNIHNNFREKTDRLSTEEFAVCRLSGAHSKIIAFHPMGKASKIISEIFQLSRVFLQLRSTLKRTILLLTFPSGKVPNYNGLSYRRV